MWPTTLRVSREVQASRVGGAAEAVQYHGGSSAGRDCDILESAAEDTQSVNETVFAK